MRWGEVCEIKTEKKLRVNSFLFTLEKVKAFLKYNNHICLQILVKKDPGIEYIVKNQEQDINILNRLYTFLLQKHKSTKHHILKINFIFIFFPFSIEVFWYSMFKVTVTGFYNCANIFSLECAKLNRTNLKPIENAYHCNSNTNKVVFLLLTLFETYYLHFFKYFHLFFPI